MHMCGGGGGIGAVDVVRYVGRVELAEKCVPYKRGTRATCSFFAGLKKRVARYVPLREGGPLLPSFFLVSVP